MCVFFETCNVHLLKRFSLSLFFVFHLETPGMRFTHHGIVEDIRQVQDSNAVFGITSDLSRETAGDALNHPGFCFCFSSFHLCVCVFSFFFFQ